MRHLTLLFTLILFILPTVALADLKAMQTDLNQRIIDFENYVRRFVL